MIKRLYIHNFRCLENFELVLDDKPSTLLIGKNGSGKSTISFALGLLQEIGRGTNRVGRLVKPIDLARRQSGLPMRFEVDVELDGHLYQFRLALELPEHFKELRVQQEDLLVDGQPIYTRNQSRVSVVRESKPAEFSVDWHLIALTIIQERSEEDPLYIFKTWLARMIILAPVPSLIVGEGAGETLEAQRDGQNLAAWFAGLIAHSPAAYRAVDTYLRGVMPDFEEIRNPMVGAETRSLLVQFRGENAQLTLPFAVLSDGEKCFIIAALVLAANDAYGPVFCFWDQPDCHLSIDEVGHFIVALRSAFERGGQVLMTSHNPEAIRRFSEDTTFVLYRRSHLEPTRVKTLGDLGVVGDLRAGGPSCVTS
jgi:energy-coupling factor transporter ATP-binding protein EcfA2